MEETGEGLALVRRWYSSKFIIFIICCVFGDGFLIFWYSAALRPGTSVILVIAPILHVIACALLNYCTLAGIMNRTRIAIGIDDLSIRHAPIPWPGNRSIPRTDLERLFVEERVYRNKGPYYTYGLNAVLKDGARVKLLSGLEDPEQALFLEQEIEARLGIQDRKTPDELRS